MLTPTARFAVAMLELDTHKHGEQGRNFVAYNDVVNLFHEMFGGDLRADFSQR